MEHVNIYKLETETARTKGKTYVVARSFGEAILLANVKDDKVTSVKCIAEKVAYMHLQKPAGEKQNQQKGE